MDSSGHIYDVTTAPDGTEKLTNRSTEPVPDPMRGVLVMKALEADPGPGKRGWWPELAPLTMKERDFVWARLGGLPGDAKESQ